MSENFTKDEIDHVGEILFPEVVKTLKHAKNRNQRFVHYTSAANAFSIIRNKSIWMRNVQYMNDTSEIKHGANKVQSFFGKNSASGTHFWAAVANINPELKNKVIAAYDNSLKRVLEDTYLTCVSEHCDDEDEVGRLSMWRAYGSQTGVALVLNPSPFHSESRELNVYSMPVLYDEKIIQRGFDALLAGIETEVEFLRKFPVEELTAAFSRALMFYTSAIKHRGFKEEQEWRVIYQPFYEKSGHITKSVETIGGIPQTVYKIPLKESVGTDLNTLINRVIIGPTNHPEALRATFIECLSELGVRNPDHKVTVSDLPLRI